MPSTSEPMRKVMLPPGIRVSPEPGATWAVTLTACPKTAGWVEEVSARLLVARATPWVTREELLPPCRATHPPP